jgi:DNA-binding MarR family transcriptional regulator
LHATRNPAKSAGFQSRCVMAVDLRNEQALKLLHEVSLGLVREAKPESMPDFTLRQLAILLTVYLENPPHTVRGLAKKLGVTKPVITRALDSMGKQDIIARRRDEVDKRNVIVQRTVKGVLYVERLGDMVSDKAREVTE